MANEIIVPRYQRAYSWDTSSNKSTIKTQTDVFLSDLEEQRESGSISPYYFGHFLFEERDEKFYVIDGQQRLTTIVIFLSALFTRLKDIGKWTDIEEQCREDMVERHGTYRFKTVGYDNTFFTDYVIDQTRIDHTGVETESGLRIVRAFDYFKERLKDKPEDYLTQLLLIISKSTCTTHTVNNESEAIQMFIFQNNRGKRPSNLEIVKAHFMYNVHLYAKSNKSKIIDIIKDRFATIYKSISSIEYRINEDDVLLHTLKVYFNSIWEKNALEKIYKELKGDDPISFIENFTQSLSTSFEHLNKFFVKDEKRFPVHSLITLGGLAIALPFIIKAYKFSLADDEIDKLCCSFENLVLRHRLVGTRADITSRISDVFENFTEINKDFQPIIDRIESLKTKTDWWWAHWNNDKLEESLQGGLNHGIAKYILWKYENHLQSEGKAGYIPIRFDAITEKPELEHIAPTTEPEEKPHGYDTYDDEFKNKYQNCLGNYLLLSKSHNASIHNDPFAKKHKDYGILFQQREVKKLVPDPNKGNWDRHIIQQRKEKIIKFIMGNF